MCIVVDVAAVLYCQGAKQHYDNADDANNDDRVTWTRIK